MVRFSDLKKQYLEIQPEIDEAMSAVMRETAFIGGPRISGFEKAFASYQQAQHCVGVANGTDALEIVLESLSLPAGSEVLVPANTFIATSEAVTRSGLKVVFCDCREDDYTMSVEDAARRITPRTRAIIPVHLYGHPCDMDSLLDLAKRHSLKIIEDCAQAHGAEYKGRRVGTMGEAGTFSFYPGKNLGAYGDAGAIITNNPEFANKCRMLANHGRIDKYDHVMEGRNSRLDGLQAAVLSVKLKHLDKWIARRTQVAKRYLEGLKDVAGITLPTTASWARHAWHLFVIRADRRDHLKSSLEGQGIQTGVHYPMALPQLKAYAYLKQANEPMFANRDNDLLSLPMGEHLQDNEVDEVCHAVRSFYLKAAPRMEVKSK